MQIKQQKKTKILIFKSYKKREDEEKYIVRNNKIEQIKKSLEIKFEFSFFYSITNAACI